MTNEERDLITQFIRRIGGAPAAPAGFGSVPSTVPAVVALPPIDREADALIADLFVRHPEARYRLTQTAFVQEFALTEAQNTINRLQWELDQARQMAAPPAQAPASPWGAAVQPQQPSRGLFGGLFGANRQPPPPYQQPYQQQGMPPQAQQAPGYQPGMFQQRGGSGFLGSALTTAAGVAGGLVVGNMLMNAFSGGSQAHAATTPAADAGGWSNATSAPDPYAAGGAPKDGGWTEASPVNYQEPEDSGWSDAGSDSED